MVWIKGQTGNGRGRPLGGVTATTKQFMKLKELAAENADEAFKMLWQNMESGEGWAFQIYFKELIPKKLKEETVLIKVQDGESRIDALTRDLNQFEELTHDEIMHEIKALSNIEFAKEHTQVENVLTIMSDEQIKTLNNMYAAAKESKASQSEQQ